MMQGYHYWERGQVVEVQDRVVSGLRVNLQLSSVAKDSLVWAHIKVLRDGTALVDRVEYGDTTRVAPSVVDARLQGRCGAGLRYGVNSWQMAMDLAAEWLMDGGPARVSVPVEGAASVRWHHPNVAAVWGMATLHGRTGVDYFRFEQSLPVTYSSDARIWVDFSIGVPLLMPLWAEQIKPRVVVEVSSLTLAGKRRQPMHPLGNAIGPAIAVRAELSNYYLGK
jgi:hypothetical protein